MVLLDVELLSGDSLFEDLKHLLTDEILLVNCIDNPVIKLLVHLLRMSVNLLKNDESPRVDKAKSVHEDLLLLLKNLSLEVIMNLLNQWIVGCEVLKLVHEA